MPSLDFDGEYGRTYRSSIRHSVPGYDTLHEIATAAVRTTGPQAQKILVVGPGPGDEMSNLFEACPNANFTVLEPSEQMLALCKERIKGHGGTHRCQFLQCGLIEAGDALLRDASFDLVICHNVLHLHRADQQTTMLRQLASLTDVGGSLLLSAYSEPEDASVADRLLAVGVQRLQDRGLKEEQLSTLLATRNQVVFSVEDTRVKQELMTAGMSSPLQLYQGLFAKLWLIQRPYR